jgi:predicted Zn-dependent peptidase
VNIREAKGYAYGPGSLLVAAPSGAAYWAELADVSTPVTWPAIREILSEIARLGAAEPDSAELEGSRRYLLGRTLVQTATRRGWAEHDHLVALMARMPAVSRSDIRRVAAAYLASRRLTIVVVGDTIALGEQLGAIRQAARALRGE